ncbi:MAG: hypothetical protein IPP97_20350 [Candidatus Obscuribacter sp.]|nr:hypothetical protein [Candidatus Obscuribacter sp.]MBP7577686.1 hypothetical protein [Candidatus Obscuribacter sp.]
MAGKISFAITEEAIKIDSPTCGYKAIAKAPDWSIWIYRPEEKELGNVSFAQWGKFNTSAVGTTDECPQTKPLACRSIAVKGLPVKAFLYTYRGEKVLPDVFQTDKTTEYSNTFIESYILTKAPQAMAIQRLLLNCDSIDGCLISCFGKDKQTGELHWLIHTLSLKPSEFKASEFELPSGYKQLKQIDQHFKFKNLSKPFDEMAEMMDIGDPSRNKKKKTGK